MDFEDDLEQVDGDDRGEPDDLEQFPADPIEEEVARLRSTLEERDASDRDNLERYRTALLATDPALTADLLAGDTFDEVDASFAAARELVARLRNEAAAAQDVPPGAPGRSANPPTSSFDKIRKGLASLG